MGYSWVWSVPFLKTEQICDKTCFVMQAMSEGILVDIPFATFFLSKLRKKYVQWSSYSYRALCVWGTVWICTISKLLKLPGALDTGPGRSILICRLSLLYCLMVAICLIWYFALGYSYIVWLVTEVRLVVVQAQLPTWSTFFGSSALSKPVVSQGMLLSLCMKLLVTYSEASCKDVFFSH